MEESKGKKLRTNGRVIVLPQNRLILLRQQRIPVATIAKSIGVSIRTVSRFFHRMGLYQRPYIRNCPLTGACVRLRRRNMTYLEISKRLGISVTMVGDRVRAVLGLSRRSPCRSKNNGVVR